MQIPTYLIKAAIPCAATKNVRKYLNGALFEWTADTHTLRAISTDGHMLSCFSVEIPTSNAHDFSVIVPIEALKLAAKSKAPAQPLEIGAPCNIGGVFFKPVDDKFPDYRRVIPAALSGKAGSYNPELLGRAADALNAYRQTKNGAYTFTQNGANDAAVMHDGTDDALEVVMPWRATKTCDIAKDYRGFK